MFELDKILHFTVSFAIFAFLVLVFPQLGVAISASITFAIGLAKEFIYDGLLKRGHKEYYDILANTLGISLGVGLHYLIFL